MPSDRTDAVIAEREVNSLVEAVESLGGKLSERDIHQVFSLSDRMRRGRAVYDPVGEIPVVIAWDWDRSDKFTVREADH